MQMKYRLYCLSCALMLSAIPACQAQTPAECGERCLTLHGKKNPDHSLGFSVAYATTAKSDNCVTHNRMAGVTTPRTLTEFMPPLRKGDSYRINIPLNKQVDGKCGWKVAGVSINVVSVASRREPPNAGYSLFGFSDAPGSVRRVDLKCRRSAYQRATGEQASYQCLTDAQVHYSALGPGSHTVELNFGERE